MNRRDSDKEGGHETKSQNTDAQRMRAPTAGLCVLCGLMKAFCCNGTIHRYSRMKQLNSKEQLLAQTFRLPLYA